MAWDWSTAGQLRDGKPYEEDDGQGNHTYMSIKGSFTWAKNVTPEYIWFNGTAAHYLLGETVRPVAPPRPQHALRRATTTRTRRSSR